MLPTPAKFHYVFNLRDLSRIWQGVLNSTSDVVHDTFTLLSLWKHECARVISDRFVNEMDKSWFRKVSMQVCSEEIGGSGYDLSCLENDAYFVDFLRLVDSFFFYTESVFERFNPLKCHLFFRFWTSVDSMPCPGRSRSL